MESIEGRPGVPQSMFDNAAKSSFGDLKRADDLGLVPGGVAEDEFDDEEEVDLLCLE